MKFKLNLHERLMFLNLLPKENNIATLRIVRTVSKEVGITDEEFKDFGIKQEEEGRISWDPKKAEKEKEFEIGEIATELIKTALKKLDDEKKLTNEHLSLYEKFMESESKDEPKQ